MVHDYVYNAYCHFIMFTYIYILVSVAITVRFSEENLQFNENVRAQPILALSSPSSFDIIINVITNDITATGVNSSKCLEAGGASDYLYGVYAVTFPANVTVRIVDIPICDDSVLEEDETFSLTIVSNSHPNNVTNGSPDHITVAIVDNDRKFYK